MYFPFDPARFSIIWAAFHGKLVQQGTVALYPIQRVHLEFWQALGDVTVPTNPQKTQLGGPTGQLSSDLVASLQHGLDKWRRGLDWQKKAGAVNAGPEVYVRRRNVLETGSEEN